MDTQSRIKLSGKEFFILTGIARAEAVIGLEDPFRGTLSEEMPFEIARVEQALQAKGWIHTEQGEPVLARELLEYIELCSRTLFTIHLKTMKAGGVWRERFLYFSSSLVVQAEIAEEGGERIYMLDQLGSPSTAWMKVMSYMEPVQRVNRNTGQLTLPGGWLEQWMSRDRIDTDPKEHLLANGCPEAVASELAQAVQAPERYASFTVYYRKGRDWRIEGIRLLRGRESHWLVRGEGNRDQLRGVSAAEIIRELGSVIERVK